MDDDDAEESPKKKEKATKPKTARKKKGKSPVEETRSASEGVKGEPTDHDSGFD